MTAGVYRIRNRVTGDAYIGSSFTVEYRVKGHQKRLALGTHENKNLQAAWNAYGAGSFSFGMLEQTVPTDDALEESERRWTARYAGRLYNVRSRPSRARPDIVTLRRRGVGPPEEVAAARATQSARAQAFYRRYAGRPVKRRRAARQGEAPE